MPLSIFSGPKFLPKPLIPLHAGTAVDADGLAVDPLAVLGGEEAHEPRDVDGQTDAVQGALQPAAYSSTLSSSSLSPSGMYSRQTAWYMSLRHQS